MLPLRSGSRAPKPGRTRPRGGARLLVRIAPAAFELATGRVVADLGGSGLEAFAPSLAGRTIAARREGALVLLEPDGRARLERLELEGVGAVVSRADGTVTGDAPALSRVFVRAGDAWVRADRYAAERARGDR